MNNEAPPSMERKERNSSTKVKFWLPDELKVGEHYIGEISVVNGMFVTKGHTDEDTAFLNKNLRDIWIPQSGIPVFEKDGDGFKETPDGKYIIKEYGNFHDSTPDGLIEALYDYTRAMKAFKVTIEPV